MTFEELHIKLNEKLSEEIDEFTKDGQNYEEKENYINQNTPRILIDIYEKEASKLFENAKNDIKFKENEEKRKEIVRFLKLKYSKALETSKRFYLWIIEMSDLYQEYVASLYDKKEDDDLDIYCVLRRIHARACQVYLEVLTLCENGFPDGAFARWRTIYELNIISQFIIKYGSKVARSYMESVMESDTSASKAYAWAKEAECFKNIKGNITFAMIKEKCENIWGIDRWEEYYKLACKLVHPSALGTYNRIGLNDIKENGLMIGQSIYGISEPAVDAAAVLVTITLAYWSIHKEITDLSIMHIMLKKWIDCIKEEYSKLDLNN